MISPKSYFVGFGLCRITMVTFSLKNPLEKINIIYHPNQDTFESERGAIIAINNDFETTGMTRTVPDKLAYKATLCRVDHRAQVRIPVLSFANSGLNLSKFLLSHLGKQANIPKS